MEKGELSKCSANGLALGMQVYRTCGKPCEIQFRPSSIKGHYGAICHLRSSQHCSRADLGKGILSFFQPVVLGKKKPTGTKLQMLCMCMKSVLEHAKMKGYGWSCSNLGSTEVFQSESEVEYQMDFWAKGTHELGAQEKTLAEVQAGGNGRLNWVSGEEEEATDGRERLGRNHQQDLATDLACMHIGGKLPKLDSKQCSN